MTSVDGILTVLEDQIGTEKGKKMQSRLQGIFKKMFHSCTACFGVDCCIKAVKLEPMDDSTKKYFWIENNLLVLGDKTELDAAIARNKK